MSHVKVQPGRVTSGDDDVRSWDFRTTDMPADMQILLSKYPRDSWQSHPGFREKTVQWLGAH